MSRWFDHFGFARVHRGLIIGPYPLDASDVGALTTAGVDEVYNLCEDAEYQDGPHAGEVAGREIVVEALAGAGITERRLPLPDYGGLPPAAIDKVVADVRAALDADRTVYLHCRAGWQRSASMAAAVMSDEGDLPIDDTLRVLRMRKPTAEPLAHQRADLLAWRAARSVRSDP